MNALIYMGVFMMYLGFRIMNGCLNEPSYNSHNIHPYNGTYSIPQDKSNLIFHPPYHLSLRLVSDQD